MALGTTKLVHPQIPFPLHASMTTAELGSFNTNYVTQ